MGVVVCWVYNVEQREEVLSLALVTASPGSFSASCHVTPSAKEKKKDLLVTKEIILGRRDQWERFRNT